MDKETFAAQVADSSNQDTPVLPDDNAEITADETNTSPEGSDLQPEPPKEEEAETDSIDYEKRYKDTQSAIQERSEALNKMINTSVELAKKNPQYLEDLAETDLSLADKISEKMNGMKYNDWKETESLKEIKESDPEEYNKEMRLRELERAEEERIATARAKFFSEKRIKETELDAQYTKVQEQLEVLDQTFVKKDIVRALEIAYSLAFPSGSFDSKPNEKLADTTAAKSGGSSQKMPGAGMKQRTPEQAAFASKF